MWYMVYDMTYDMIYDMIWHLFTAIGFPHSDSGY
jgi:hypothetical protein